MTLRAFPMLNDLSDSLFADRFNRIDRLFSQLTGSTPLPSTPSYNIRRVGDNRYELTLSVPGWKESELEIETVGGQLNISGKREEEKTENGEEGWIHRGISRSDFRASYSLPEHVKITGASLETACWRLNYTRISRKKRNRSASPSTTTRRLNISRNH